MHFCISACRNLSPGAIGFKCLWRYRTSAIAKLGLSSGEVAIVGEPCFPIATSERSLPRGSDAVQRTNQRSARSDD
jgi:hypothetical protein